MPVTSYVAITLRLALNLGHGTGLYQFYMLRFHPFHDTIRRLIPYLLRQQY